MTVETIGPFHPYDSNIHLIIGTKTALIDAGTGLSDRPISEIRKLLNGRPLDYLILTHCHFDHIGGAEAIINEFSPQVFAGKYDAEAIRIVDQRYVLNDMFNNSLNGIAVEDLSDGEVIDLEDHRLRVIETPGHTIGSICLFDECTHDLFSGDTVFKDGIGRTDFPGGSTTELLLSLKRLATFRINGLYSGHGNNKTSNGNESINNGIMMVGY